ncbi:hypothetical protein ACVWWO_003282 [Bradyrhizobium sp. F1.13.1]
MTSSGRFVTEPISSMLSAEVLVAMIAPGLQIASSFSKTFFLRSIRSNTASMTRSQSLKSFMLSEPVSSPRRSSTCSRVKPPRAAVRS